jgi:hypothetical protein
LEGEIMASVQTFILSRQLEDEGLTPRQGAHILRLLSFKPEKVQIAFYYRSMGLNQEEIADKIDSTQRQVSRVLSRDCKDIKIYLKKNKKNV